jgi:hypothetical protein
LTNLKMVKIMNKKITFINVYFEKSNDRKNKNRKT